MVRKVPEHEVPLREDSYRLGTKINYVVNNLPRAVLGSPFFSVIFFSHCYAIVFEKCLKLEILM